MGKLIIRNRSFGKNGSYPANYDDLGVMLEYGYALIGLVPNGEIIGQGHTVNIIRMEVANKYNIFGGGYKRVLYSTSVWDPAPELGHVSNGPTYFSKIIMLY